MTWQAHGLTGRMLVLLLRRAFAWPSVECNIDGNETQWIQVAIKLKNNGEKRRKAERQGGQRKTHARLSFLAARASDETLTGGARTARHVPGLGDVNNVVGDHDVAALLHLA